MMPTEQADRSTRVYSAVGIGRELRTSNFLLALMAAAAKSTRSDLDEAEERIEELEKDAEIVSEEFEGDCWKAVRTLLERVGWTDFSEGVTAQDACEIIGDAIHESRSQAQALTAERDGLQARVGELEGLLNTPELEDFSRAVVLEAAHQRNRWAADHDAGKAPEDWFWLLGYLGGKALHAAKTGDVDKAKHHTISTAAALANWHAAINGDSNAMRPGIDPVARALLTPPAPHSDGER